MRLLKFGYRFGTGRSYGKIVVRHKGGGLKRLYHPVDLGYYLSSFIRFKTLSVLRDSTRSSLLGFTLYANGLLAYRLLSKINVRLPFLLKWTPEGSKINSLEAYYNCGAKYIRAAGSGGLVVRRYAKLVLVRLPSGCLRLFSGSCFCSYGYLPTIAKRIKNAGYNRRRGVRPTVRGYAMNPVDHPHGGRTKGGMVPATPWGRVAKGIKTSRLKFRSRHLLHVKVK